MATVIDDLPVKTVRAAMQMESNRVLMARWQVSISTVVRWRTRLGMTRARRYFPAPRRAHLLAVLAQHPSGLRLGELARIQNITTQAMAGALKYAMHAGLVEKRGGRWRLVTEAVGAVGIRGGREHG